MQPSRRVRFLYAYAAITAAGMAAITAFASTRRIGFDSIGFDSIGFDKPERRQALE